MKQFTIRTARHGAVGTDQGDIEAKCAGHRQSKSVPSASNESDLDALGVCACQSFEIGLGYLELRVQESAVDVDCDEPDRHEGIVNGRPK